MKTIHPKIEKLSRNSLSISVKAEGSLHHKHFAVSCMASAFRLGNLDAI